MDQFNYRKIQKVPHEAMIKRPHKWNALRGRLDDLDRGEVLQISALDGMNAETWKRESALARVAISSHGKKRKIKFGVATHPEDHKLYAWREPLSRGKSALEQISATETEMEEV